MTPIRRLESEDGFVAISSDDDLLNQTIIKKNAYAALMKMKNTGEEEELECLYLMRLKWS